jgi:hypothetical protein
MGTYNPPPPPVPSLYAKIDEGIKTSADILDSISHPFVVKREESDRLSIDSFVKNTPTSSTPK